MKHVWVALVALALLAFAPIAHGAKDGRTLVAGNPFPEITSSYYLTATRGNVGGESNVLTLAPTSPSTQSQTTFLAPGVSVLGIVNQPNVERWFSPTPADKDIEVTQDTSASLYFTANAQATTIFDVRLYDVPPTGAPSLVDSDQQQFITALAATAVQFPLHTQGVIIHQGHFLELEVYAQTVTAAVILDYGGSQAGTNTPTPSGIAAFVTRWLDTDGDGIADSDEVAAGTNPLDPQSHPGDLAVDSDHDGLSDDLEHTLGTDPHKVDTDGDGYGDGVEYNAGSDPLDKLSTPVDINHNGLPDSFENRYFDNRVYNNTTYAAGGAGTGLTDDPDHDGCNNLCEAAHGTDPLNPDTDGDGVSDGQEIARGTNPLQTPEQALAEAAKAGNPLPEPGVGAILFAGTSVLTFVALLRRP